MGIEISYTKRMLGFFNADENLVDNGIKDYEGEPEGRYFGEE